MNERKNDCKVLIAELKELGKDFGAKGLYGFGGVCQDAVVAIEALLAERDAAVTMLRGECHACKYNAGWHNIGKCGACIHETARFPKKEERRADNWEWRGLTEKERQERLERSDTP